MKHSDARVNEFNFLYSPKHNSVLSLSFILNHSHILMTSGTAVVYKNQHAYIETTAFFSHLFA